MLFENGDICTTNRILFIMYVHKLREIHVYFLKRQIRVYVCACLWVHVNTHSMRDVLMSISYSIFASACFVFFGLCIVIVF